jgi:P-type Ca2+ transporter type 2C
MATAKTPATLPKHPHSLSAGDLLARMGVSVMNGLADEEAKRRRNTFGPNTIVSRRKATALLLLLHQFQSPVVYLLSAAAALAFYFGELEEGSAVAVVLALNALIGFLTELKAARSIEALRALGIRSARVRRDGHVRLIPAEQMVPGDIVVLEAGDAVSADLRLVEASNVAADESTLTGESVAVHKRVRPVAADARLADRTSMLFKGTSLTRGSGIGVVTATGLSTELGRVSQLVEEAEPGSSPLERKLARLSAQLVWAVLLLAALIAGVGLITGKDAFLMVEAAIALAVAAIPEGLPIVATLALARGMWRMARQNALIERLSAVETLGATTVILTDKTGTLTENRMTVRRLWVPSGEVELDAKGYARPQHLRDDTQLSLLLEIAVLCNDASLDSAHEQGSGDPMELALLRAGFRFKLKRPVLLQHNPLVGKHAFDTTSKMMATVHRRAPYLTPMAEVMHLVPPSSIMWALILGLSAAPVVVTQVVMLTLASLRPRA